MKIAVTGTAGFVGSAISHRFLESGHQVLGLDAFLDDLYDVGTKRRRVEQLEASDRFQLVEQDLRTMNLDGLFEDCEYVVHLAALTGLIDDWSSIEKYTSCNLLGTAAVLREVSKSGSSLVHASTSSVYGGIAIGDESQDTRPISPYGVTKLAAEHMVNAFASRHGVKATILRYFSIYGPDQRPDMGYYRFCEAMLDGREIGIYGDGTGTRSPTYIDDVVTGTVLAMEHFTRGSVYNLAGPETISTLKAVEVLARALDVEPNIRFLPKRAGDQKATRGDYSAASTNLGYTPLVGPDEGLSYQARWHIEQRRHDPLTETPS